MKKKNWIILIATALLLVIAAGLFYSQKDSTLDRKENAFGIPDTASITRIYLADKNDNQVLLSEVQPGEWQLNDSLPARIEGVNKLLETLHDLAIERPVSNAAHNSVVSRLASRSVKVEVYQKRYRINLFDKIKLFPFEKNTKTFFVGGETQDKLGTFMLMEGAERPYIVGIPGFRGFVSTRFTALFRDWRSHIVFHSDIKEIKELTVKYDEKPEDSFRIEVEDNRRFRLFDVHKDKYLNRFDTVKVIEYLTAYSDLRYEKWLNHLPKQRIDSLTQGEPFYYIKLEEKDGDSQGVKAYRKKTTKKTDMDGKPLTFDPDRMYATINDGNDFVMIQFFAFDKVLKPIGYFTGEYKEQHRSNFQEVTSQ